MKNCPKCSLDSGEELKFCPACGTNLQSDLERFLEAQGISQLAGAMKAHDITSLEVLKELGENDISELGLAYGDKVRIKVAIESLKKPEVLQKTDYGLITSIINKPQESSSASSHFSEETITPEIVENPVSTTLPSESANIPAPLLRPSVQTVANQTPQLQGSAGNVIAALCSLFVPGLGQLLQGRIGPAIGFFISSGVLWCFLLGWIIHIWACVNAARWKMKS